MVVSTTGSLVVGTVKGLRGGLEGPRSPLITYVIGNPDAVLTVQTGSDLAIDWTNATVYIGLASNGSTWYKLGSTT